MILTGAKLEEMGLAVWGHGWGKKLARRLKKSAMAISRLRQRNTGHPKELKRVLLEMAEEQLVTVAAYVDELRDDLGA